MTTFVGDFYDQALAAGDCTGDLVIGGVHLSSRPAWTTLDLGDLCVGPAQRVNNVTVPGVDGTAAYAPRADQTTVNIPFIIIGGVDGTPGPTFGQRNNDPVAGFFKNLRYLITYVVRPTHIGNGTRAAVLTEADGLVRSGAVQVLGLPLGDRDYRARCRATLTFIIPGGELT